LKTSKKSQSLDVRNKWNNQIDTYFKAKYSLILSYLTTSDGIASKIEEENIPNTDLNSILIKWFPSPVDIYRRIIEVEGDKELTDIQNRVLKCSVSIIYYF